MNDHINCNKNIKEVCYSLYRHMVLNFLLRHSIFLGKSVAKDKAARDSGKKQIITSESVYSKCVLLSQRLSVLHTFSVYQIINYNILFLKSRKYISRWNICLSQAQEYLAPPNNCRFPNLWDVYPWTVRALWVSTTRVSFVTINGTTCSWS